MPKQAARAARKGGGGQWLQGLGCGALIAFATPTALTAAALLAPVAICRLLDSEPGRPVTRAVAICVIPGCIGPLWRLWQQRDTMQAALDLLADPATIATAWAAAACAWACCQVLPVLIRSVWTALDAANARKLEAALRALREEWDSPEA